MDVMVGSTHWNGGTRIGVERAVIHPEYDRRRFINDIALLKLSSNPVFDSENQIYANPSSNLDSFSSSSNSPLTSSYSDNKNIFDIPTSLFPSSSSSQSLSQLASLSSLSNTDTNFPNLPPLDSKISDDTLSQSDSHNSIWNDENTEESSSGDTNSFFKRKKSKTDWFFDTQQLMIDDKDDEMNNRLNEDNNKKDIVSEYFKIRARSNVEAASAQEKTNDTISEDDKKPNQNSSIKVQKYRDSHEFDADAIKIPEYFMQFKGTATVVGWGLVSESDRLGTDHLMAANVRILENDQCKNYKNFEEDTQICAGYSNGGVDACAGDSGGGLVTMVKSNPFLIGIVSYGLGCGRKNFPGNFQIIT